LEVERNTISTSTKSIYLDCYLLTNDAGCHLHYAIVSPIVSYSIEQTQYIYVEMLQQQLFLMVWKVPSLLTTLLRSEHCQYHPPPINTQFLGYSPNHLFRLFSLALTKYFPHLLMTIGREATWRIDRRRWSSDERRKGGVDQTQHQEKLDEPHNMHKK